MSVTQTIDSLGLGDRVTSEVEFVRLVEEGLPLATVDEVKRLGALSDVELAQIIPRRTLAHARKRPRLSPEQSDRIARAAGVFTLAHDTFLDRRKANDWMRAPNGALDGETPLSLLRTGSGAELVANVLGRIAYGVYD
jgi:putative toxin-antitoxin system antitoxin component (TIGR02293 family)